MSKFDWKAIYSDGVVKQYPFQRPETNFGVIVKMGMPNKFYVGNKYGVNLITGQLLFDRKWNNFGDVDGVPNKPTELIYFRRSMASVNGGGRQIWHFVGYKHAGGIVRLCIPDDGSPITICTGV
jgi:hypothetical protein